MGHGIVIEQISFETHTHTTIPCMSIRNIKDNALKCSKMVHVKYKLKNKIYFVPKNLS